MVPPKGLPRHSRTDRNVTPQAVQGRRSGVTQYAENPLSAVKRFSLPALVLHRGQGDWFRDSHQQVLPRHLDKQWGKGKLCLKSRKYLLPSHSDLTTQLYSTIVNLIQN